MEAIKNFENDYEIHLKNQQVWNIKRQKYMKNTQTI